MKKLRLTILAIAATMFANNASAFDPDDVQKLKDKRSCWQCDLSDADLSSANLLGTMLDGADFSNANLTEVDFTGANLTSVRLKGAIFCKTIAPDGRVFNQGC